MTQREPAFDCLFDTISSFLLPFFLTGAAGDPDAARVAIAALINAYNPSTTAQLDLIGRIIGFSIVAMDNLRLSMTPGLSDTKVLQYRSSAVSLNRAAEQARQILGQVQQQREVTHEVPRPSIVPAPTPAPASRPAVATPPRPPLLATNTQHALSPRDIEAMKYDARTMIAAFSKHDVLGGAAIPAIPDPVAAISSAARVAVSAVANQHKLTQQSLVK